MRDVFGRRIGTPAAPPLNPAPQPLPPDPNLQRGLMASQNQRATTLGAIDAEDRDYRRNTGLTTGADGTLALDFGDPRSRAYALQAQWQKAKTVRKQGAGWNMYSGGFQDELANDAASETSAYADLLAGAQSQVAALNARRQQAYADQETRDSDLVSAYRDSLSADVNDATSPNRSVGVNPDGSSRTSGQGGVSHATGAPFVLWHDSKGRAYHVYKNGKRVRMPAKDKK
jgi:hypothetical protein